MASAVHSEWQCGREGDQSRRIIKGLSSTKAQAGSALVNQVGEEPTGAVKAQPKPYLRWIYGDYWSPGLKEVSSGVEILTRPEPFS